MYSNKLINLVRLARLFVNKLICSVFKNKKKVRVKGQHGRPKNLHLFPAVARRKCIIALFLLIAIVGGVIAPVGAEVAHAAIPILAWGILAGVGYFFGGQILDSTAAALGSLVADLMAWVSQWLFALSVYLLDLSIGYSLKGENLKLEGIKEGWSIMRDIGNISFLFILIYIAIATILQASGINTKKALATLILIALLVNFSFFLTGIVVDAGNILALVIYNAMIEPGPIGDQLANGLDLESIYEFDDGSIIDSVLSFLGIGEFDTIVIKLFGSVVILIAAFVFLSLALLFILRSIVLMFLLVLSPFAFIAAVLPGTNQHFKQWLHHLINHSFVAPITLLLLFVVLQIVNSDEIKKAIENFTGEKTGTYIGAIIESQQELPNIDAYQIFLLYILIMGLLVGTLIISKRMAGQAATLAIKYAGRGPGALVGLAAWTSKHTIGRGIRRYAESEKMKDRASRSAGWEFVQKRMEGLSQRSFDPRAFGVTRAIAAGLGTDFGKSGRGTDFSAKKAIGEREKRAAALAVGPGGEARVKAYTQRLRGSIFTRMGITRGINEAAAGKIEERARKERLKRIAPALRRERQELKKRLKEIMEGAGGTIAVTSAGIALTGRQQIEERLNEIENELAEAHSADLESIKGDIEDIKGTSNKPSGEGAA